MDSDTDAELRKIAEQLDGYEYPPCERSNWTTNDYLGYGTTVYTQNAQTTGANVVIIGGQHGIEPAGWETAERLVNMTPDSGYIKYIPRADPTAINSGTYSGDGGNMNRQWGTGGEPETEQVANLWNEITTHEPDLVIDLHSSNGIYSEDTGVGQCVFPTPGAVDAADSVISQINSKYFGDSYWEEKYDFTRGNDQTGANDKLSHKVGGDLSGTECLLIETTREGTTLDERNKWTLDAVRFALNEYGIQMN